MKCLNCIHWKADEWQLDPDVKINQPDTNNAICEKINYLIEIILGYEGHIGCGGGEYIDKIYTNQNFFCAGFEKQK